MLSSSHPPVGEPPRELLAFDLRVAGRSVISSTSIHRRLASRAGRSCLAGGDARLARRRRRWLTQSSGALITGSPPSRSSSRAGDQSRPDARSQAAIRPATTRVATSGRRRPEARRPAQNTTSHDDTTVPTRESGTSTPDSPESGARTDRDVSSRSPPRMPHRNKEPRRSPGPPM